MTTRPSFGSTPSRAGASVRAPAWSRGPAAGEGTQYTLRVPHRLGGVLCSSASFDPATPRRDVAVRLRALRNLLWGRDRAAAANAVAPGDVAASAAPRRKASGADSAAAAERALAAALATTPGSDRPPWDEEAEAIAAYARQADESLHAAITSSLPAATSPAAPIAAEPQPTPQAASTIASTIAAGADDAQLGFSF